MLVYVGQLLQVGRYLAVRLLDNPDLLCVGSEVSIRLHLHDALSRSRVGYAHISSCSLLEAELLVIVSFSKQQLLALVRLGGHRVLRVELDPSLLDHAPLISPVGFDPLHPTRLGNEAVLDHRVDILTAQIVVLRLLQLLSLHLLQFELLHQFLLQLGLSLLLLLLNVQGVLRGVACNIQWRL